MISRNKPTICVIVIIVLFICVRINNDCLAIVQGESMFPTLSSGDVIVVNKSNIDLSPLNIVLIRVKTNSIRSEYIVKRIIAVGGDHIIIDYVANSVKVNGMALVEPYININVADPMQTYDDGKQVVEYIVPNDCVFVLGDNRNHSTDSRSIHIGMVSKKDVIGVVKKCLIL